MRKDKKMEKKRGRRNSKTHVSLLVGAVASFGDDAAAGVDEHAADGHLLPLERGGGLFEEVEVERG